MLFRKTLLALAGTATALPTHAQTVQLTNAGFVSQHQEYPEDLEISGKEGPIRLISFYAHKDLILNATINSSGDFADGLDMDLYSDENTASINNGIDGNLINKGSISAIGGGANTLMIDPALIGGSVINEGLLYVKGEPLLDDGDIDAARDIDISGSTIIHGDLMNTASGRIIAEGQDAKGVSMEGKPNEKPPVVRSGAFLCLRGQPAYLAW